MAKSSIRMTVLGDSISWGQGLRTEDKFSTLVAKNVEKRSGLAVDVTTLAHSGAKIGLIPLLTSSTLPKPGEVPSDQPTISQQQKMMKADSADIILLSGGINDVGIVTILNPLTSTDDLLRSTKRHCYDAMLRLLLDITDPVTGNPNAQVVVAGYYPILSTLSNLELVRAFLVSIGVVLAGPSGKVVGEIVAGFTIADMEKQCMDFYQESSTSLAGAIEETKRLRGPNCRIWFADPGFGLGHAALTKSSWIWGLGAVGNPTDPMSIPRKSQCDDNTEAGWEREFCYRASLGHPNELGAKAYATAIFSLLDYKF